jgi:hypothetical protein
VNVTKLCRSEAFARAAHLLFALMLLACNAPSKDGLFSRSGAAGVPAAGASGAGGAGGSEAGAGGGSSNADASGIGGSGQAGTGDAGSGGESDAGLDAADAAPEPDAAPTCSGTLVGELCWHLGEPGESCTQTCASRGGYDERATVLIGSEDQGGSLEQCALILDALLNEEANTSDDNDEPGVGCHLRGGDQDRVWLQEPDFSPDESLDDARIACACRG